MRKSRSKLERDTGPKYTESDLKLAWQRGWGGGVEGVEGVNFERKTKINFFSARESTRYFSRKAATERYLSPFKTTQFDVQMTLSLMPRASTTGAALKR